MNKKILIILIPLLFLLLTFLIYFKYFRNNENDIKNELVETVETIDKTIPDYEVTQSPTMFKVISWGNSANTVIVNKSWPVESNKNLELQLDCKQNDLFYVNSFNQSKVLIDLEIAKQIIMDKEVEAKLLSGICGNKECSTIISNCILTAYEK